MDLVGALLGFVFILPAIIVHEVAHGLAALALGDTTAKDRGRLTANPIAHIDPFGTILLPIVMLAVSGGSFSFGYAKPVPINPHRFKDYRMGMLLTGLAGPASNLLLAALSATVFRAVLATGGLGVWESIARGAVQFAYMNLVLMFFNLIPIPPLDGSRVLPVFLSDRAMRVYGQVERYGFFVIIALTWIGPDLFGFDPIDAYLNITAVPVLRLLFG